MKQILSIRKTVKSILSVVYMIQVVLTVPLSFEIGGNICGLAFTFTLSLIYFCLNTLRVASLYSGKKFSLLRFLFYLQHLFIPSLLFLFLSSFNDRLNVENGVFLDSFVKVWNFIIKNCTSVFIILEGICTLLLIQAIGKSFNWVIYRSASSGSNEFKILLNLLISGTILTISFYFLYNIFIIPDLKINLFNSTLLGSIVTYCLGLSVFGIISSKSNLIESVLIFAYIVKCIYQTFPQLTNLTNNQINELITKTTWNFKNEFNENLASLLKFDYKYYKYYTPLLDFGDLFKGNSVLSKLNMYSHVVYLNLTNSFNSLSIFMVDAITHLTLSLVINLAFRILVFYAATRIIPALKGTIQNKSAIVESSDLPDLDDEMDEADDADDADEPDEKLYTLADNYSTLSDSSNNNGLKHQRHLRKRVPQPPHRKATLDKSRVLYSYSPCFIIAVYTNLMLLQRNEIDQNLVLWGWWSKNSDDLLIVNQIQFWNWLNMLIMLVVYTLELMSESD